MGNLLNKNLSENLNMNKKIEFRISKNKLSSFNFSNYNKILGRGNTRKDYIIKDIFRDYCVKNLNSKSIISQLQISHELTEMISSTKKLDKNEEFKIVIPLWQLIFCAKHLNCYIPEKLSLMIIRERLDFSHKLVGE